MNEIDPNGFESEFPGAKFDGGKPWSWTVMVGFGDVLNAVYKDRIWSAGTHVAAAVFATMNCGKTVYPIEAWEGVWREPVMRSLLSARGLQGVMLDGTFGARKYSRFGFRAVPEAVERYREAGGRHLVRWLEGQDLDDDSGLNHLDVWLWNIMAEITCDNRKAD